MAYGMRIYDTDGTTVYYDSSSEGGVFIEFLRLFADDITTTRSITYDGNGGRRNLQNMSLKAIILTSGDVGYDIIEPQNNGGYPRIDYKQTSASLQLPLYERDDTLIMVLAR